MKLTSDFVGLLKKGVEMLDIVSKFVAQRFCFTASEVYPGLFQSSKIRTKEDIETVNDLGVKCVVDLEGGLDSEMDFLDTYLFWPIHDLHFLPDTNFLYMVCRFIEMQVSWGTKVLVHCSQGLNRAGLVCARVMIMKGLCGREAIAKIREKRPGALWNPVFAEFIEKFE
jgi:protein-tyrosine phosphatase